MFENIFCKVRAINTIHPELRFQQIMSIAAKKAGWNDNDLFYCPNEIILKGLTLFLEEYSSQC